MNAGTGRRKETGGSIVTGASSLRVLVTTSTFPGSLHDGTPRFVFDLAQALTKSADVRVHAPSAPNARAQERWHRVDIRRFGYFRPRRLQCLTPGIRDNLRTSWLAKLQVIPFLVCSMLTLNRQIADMRPDVVNAHWIIPQGLLAAVLRAWRRDFLLVLHAHAGDVDLLSRVPLGRALARFVVARSDLTFTAGNQVTERLDHLIGGRSGAIARPMGVDLDVFSKVDDLPPIAFDRFPAGFIFFVGRLVQKKGVDILMDAFPLVLASNPGLGLVIAGDGPMRPELVQRSSEIGVADAIAFTGPLSHAEVARHMQSCRAVVIPSIIDRHAETEGTPTVLMEAMAAGTLVVASDVAGIPEVISDGTNGWLARPGDAEDLARALRAALQTEADSGVRRAARLTAEENSWDRVAAEYLLAIESVRSTRGTM